MLGWKTSGTKPSYRKYILVVAPHTSNWDFLVGVGARASIDFYPRYLGKKELFIWPFGALFRKLGGYPVERDKATNFVQSVVSIFEENDDFILTITPEGTRSYNEHWKTGFYYIAKEANIPIIPVGFDYPSKTVVLGEAVFATEPVDDVVKALKKWFSQFTGKIPSNGVREVKEGQSNAHS